jgi:uncharacterized Tic20 family protein
MTTTETRHRPGGITFIVVLAYLAFIFQILGGILIWLEADERRAQLDTGLTESQLTATALAMIVIGVIGILLTGALGRGSNVVRILFGVWVAFQVAGGLYLLVSHSGEQRASGVPSIVFGVIVLYLLFNERAHDYFAKD